MKGISNVDLIKKLNELNMKAYIKIFLVLFFILLLFFLMRASGVEIQDLTPLKVKEFILSFGFFKGALVYLGVYALSLRPFVPIPPTLYTLAGGFTFGPLWGTILTVTGATLNACISFLVARVLGKDFVEKISKGKLEKINEKLSKSDFKTLLLIRTSPIGPPFDLVSYASGVLRVSFWNYFFATLIGIIPATAVYSYFGGSISKGGWAILIGFFLIVVTAVIFPWYLRRRKAGR